MTYEKTVHRGHVVVVLVLGRLAGLWLDQNRAFEADLVFVLDHHVEKTTQLVHLLPDPRVEQRFVTFPATPQHVVFTPELQRGVHGLLHLQCRHREDFRVRIGGGATHEPPMTEKVGRAPQQLHAGGGLLGVQHINHATQVVDTFLRRGSFGGHVAVVHAVVRRTQLAEKVERCIGLHAGRLHRVGNAVPGPLEGSVVAEHVKAIPGERVPVARGKAQLVFHAFAQHDPVAVVPLERQWIAGVGTFVTNDGDGAEVVGHGLALGFRGTFEVGGLDTCSAWLRPDRNHGVGASHGEIRPAPPRRAVLCRAVP